MPNSLPPPSSQRLWFNRSHAVDNFIRHEFEDDLHDYLHDRNNSVPAAQSKYIPLEKTPHGALALTILIGEFAHRMYRYNGDTREEMFKDSYNLTEDACILAWMSISHDHDQIVSQIERTFFVTPFIHHERIQGLTAAQSRCENYLRTAPRVREQQQNKQLRQLHHRQRLLQLL